MKPTFIINYQLCKIPEELWRAVKSKCGAQGVTIRQTVLTLLDEWVKDKKKVR